MKLEVVLVLGLGACGAAAPPPPAPVVAQSSCPAPELSCKDAVERASASAHLHGRDVTMAIGECEQHSWNLEARKCVAAVHANADLVTCGSTYELGDGGIFRDPNSIQRAFTAMTKFRDEMCVCKDSPCAQKVSDEMTKWGQEEAKSERDPPKLSDEDVKRFTQLGQEMGTCMQKAMSSGTP